MTAELVDFHDADSDRPGIVVDPTADESSFWLLVADEAWENEWWYDEPGSAEFWGKEYGDVKEDWQTWVQTNVKAPQWGWYAWRSQPDDDEIDEYLDRADDGESGAFLAAPVIFERQNMIDEC